MAQVILISECDAGKFQELAQNYCAQGWTLGNLSTAILKGPNDAREIIYYSMVVTDMTYIPQTGSLTVTAISAAYTVAPTDQYIEATTSGTSYAITLPAATGSGRTLNIKKVTSGNTITITPNGTDTIDGGANLTLKQQNTAYSLIDAVAGKWEIY